MLLKNQVEHMEIQSRKWLKKTLHPPIISLFFSTILTINSFSHREKEFMVDTSWWNRTNTHSDIPLISQIFFGQKWVFTVGYEVDQWVCTKRAPVSVDTDAAWDNRRVCRLDSLITEILKFSSKNASK